MSREIIIKVAGTELRARLNETDTAARVLEILPINASANLWGEEIYFATPLEHSLEDAQETVSAGDIAFWPQGNALCLFFGPTPVSTADEIKPLSAVNVVGRIEDDLAPLKKVKQGDKITMDKGRKV